MRIAAGFALITILLSSTVPLHAADDVKARAEVTSSEGKVVGVLQLDETPDGVSIEGKLEGLPPGEHAFHIHETGKCDPPFKTAGGHFNPDDMKHGQVEGGPHAGDMSNVEVAEDGTVEIDVVNDLVTLAKDKKSSLFDSDGSAIVFHAKADDYKSQPSGAAGDRIACGVVK